MERPKHTARHVHNSVCFQITQATTGRLISMNKFFERMVVAVKSISPYCTRWFYGMFSCRICMLTIHDSFILHQQRRLSLENVNAGSIYICLSGYFQSKIILITILDLLKKKKNIINIMKFTQWMKRIIGSAM